MTMWPPWIKVIHDILSINIMLAKQNYWPLNLIIMFLLYKTIYSGCFVAQTTATFFKITQCYTTKCSFAWCIEKVWQSCGPFNLVLLWNTLTNLLTWVTTWTWNYCYRIVPYMTIKLLKQFQWTIWLPELQEREKS